MSDVIHDQCRISHLIKALTEIQAREGDLHVYVPSLHDLTVAVSIGRVETCDVENCETRQIVGPKIVRLT